jgi:hypothetical protein
MRSSLAADDAMLLRCNYWSVLLTYNNIMAFKPTRNKLECFMISKQSDHQRVNSNSMAACRVGLYGMLFGICLGFRTKFFCLYLRMVWNNVQCLRR